MFCSAISPHFGALIKIPYGNMNPLTLSQVEAYQLAQQWQTNYAANRQAPPSSPPPSGGQGQEQGGSKPPPPPKSSGEQDQAGSNAQPQKPPGAQEQNGSNSQSSKPPGAQQQEGESQSPSLKLSFAQEQGGGNKPSPPPSKPIDLDQLAIRIDHDNIYVANGEHAALLHAMPTLVDRPHIKFDVLA